MISKDEVKKIAVLARLSLEDAEVDQLASDLGALLGYMEKLESLPLDGVEPLSHPLPLANIVRKDEPMASLTAEQALEGSAETQDGFFKVPKILD